MNWLDILLLVLTGLAGLLGWRIGIIRVVVTAIGIIVGILLAGRLFPSVAPIFNDVIDSSNGANVAAFVLVFIVALATTALVGSLIKKISKFLMLDFVDKTTGLLFGALIALLVSSSILSMIEANPILNLEEPIKESTLASFLVEDFDILLRLTKILPENLNPDLPDL